MNPKLKSINLRRNVIGDEGAKHLARVLQTGVHPELTTLQLDYNQIGPAGAESLAQGLAKLPNFPVVALNGNQIGDRGTSNHTNPPPKKKKKA
jgi:Ran GTPase-activating protein (RanGAP) involved in mRNA processing and transport